MKKFTLREGRPLGERFIVFVPKKDQDIFFAFLCNVMLGESLYLIGDLSDKGLVTQNVNGVDYQHRKKVLTTAIMDEVGEEILVEIHPEVARMEVEELYYTKPKEPANFIILPMIGDWSEVPEEAVA